MKWLRYFIYIFILILGSSILSAQDDTTTDEPTNTVSYFFVACEDRAIVDLDGTMLDDSAVYVQVFQDLSASGTALTGLERVSVTGDYQVSLDIPYNEGQTLALGQFASARISIAGRNDSSAEVFADTVDDIQDGCADPSYSTTATTSAGSGGTTVTVVDPETGRNVEVPEGNLVSTGIYTPNGGTLNPSFVPTVNSEAVVVIGDRPSEDINRIPGRTANPGLIFAECNKFDGASPGTLFDTDNLTVFWSWFAETPELVREHIDKAQYRVVLNSPANGTQTFPNVIVSPVVQREDGNYWVFYTADLGDGFKLGDYSVGYRVEWSEPISDGFENFGPGTETPFIESNCSFTIQENPWGVDVNRVNPTLPLQSQ